MSDKQKIAAKMLLIYEAIDCVEKNGKNKAQSYDYVRAADVVRAVRKECMAQKIYAEINMDFVGAPYTIARAKEINAPFAAVNVKCSIVAHDVETGEFITASGLGTGADSSDKSVFKAQTGALKYALRHAALIPDEAESDPEADETVDEEPDFQQARHQAPSPRPAAVAPKAAAPKEAAPAPKPTTPSETAPVPSMETKTTSSATPAVAPSTPEAAPTADKGVAPPETELAVYRSKFSKLGDDLSTLGKLKASKSLPLNRKLLIFLLKITEAPTAQDITKAQWDDFFSRVEHVKGLENGWVGLAKLVNKANGIEEKTK